MATSRRHGHKKPEGSTPADDGAVDYSGELATQVVPEGGQDVYKSGVQVDYEAASRRPSRPPNYNLQRHYQDRGSGLRQAIKTYHGPENFAPRPIEHGTRTDTSSVPPGAENLIAWVEVNHTPSPSASGLRPASPTVTQREEEDTTTQYQSAPLPQAPPSSASPPAHSLQRISGGFSEVTSPQEDDEVISISGIPSSYDRAPSRPRHAPARKPPPLAPQAQAAAPRPAYESLVSTPALAPPGPPAPPPAPLAPPPAPREPPAARMEPAPTHTEPTPPPPSPASWPGEAQPRSPAPARPQPRPMRAAPRPEPELEPPGQPRQMEPSDVFIADEFEDAALRSSPWLILSALAVVLTLLATVLVLFLLLLANPWKEPAPTPAPPPQEEEAAPEEAAPAKEEAPRPAVPEAWESGEPYEEAESP